MSDQDFVLIRYIHPNRGQHPVVGPATRTNYGMRAFGDEFLVQRKDVEAVRHLFEELRQTPVPVPVMPPPTTPPPTSLGWGTLNDKIVKVLEGEGFEGLGDLRGIPTEQLLTIKGIGKATANSIQSQLS